MTTKTTTTSAPEETATGWAPANEATMAAMGLPEAPPDVVRKVAAAVGAATEIRYAGGILATDVWGGQAGSIAHAHNMAYLAAAGYKLSNATLSPLLVANQFQTSKGLKPGQLNPCHQQRLTRGKDSAHTGCLCPVYGVPRLAVVGRGWYAANPVWLKLAANGGSVPEPTPEAKPAKPQAGLGKLARKAAKAAEPAATAADTAAGSAILSAANNATEGMVAKIVAKRSKGKGK